MQFLWFEVFYLCLMKAKASLNMGKRDVRVGYFCVFNLEVTCREIANNYIWVYGSLQET